MTDREVRGSVTRLVERLASELEMFDRPAVGAPRPHAGLRAKHAPVWPCVGGFSAAHGSARLRGGGQSVIGVVSVDELTRAYQAAVSGEFRTTSHLAASASDEVATWAPAPTEQVVVVVGCHGGAGASTVALGLADAAGEARVVECCTAAASGLAAAASAELGVTEHGWVRGSRGSVLIDRCGERIGRPPACPAPSPGSVPLTVVDCGWNVDLLASHDGWLGELVRNQACVVVVARPTVPGLRRLEAAADLLGQGRLVAAVVGLEKRWPRNVERALGPHGRTLRAEGRLIGLAHNPTLAFNGLTPEPLPASIGTACSALLTLTKGLR